MSRKASHADNSPALKRSPPMLTTTRLVLPRADLLQHARKCRAMNSYTRQWSLFCSQGAAAGQQRHVTPMCSSRQVVCKLQLGQDHARKGLPASPSGAGGSAGVPGRALRLDAEIRSRRPRSAPSRRHPTWDGACVPPPARGSLSCHRRSLQNNRTEHACASHTASLKRARGPSRSSSSRSSTHESPCGGTRCSPASTGPPRS